jgi:hypothetical protein
VKRGVDGEGEEGGSGEWGGGPLGVAEGGAPLGVGLGGDQLVVGVQEGSRLVDPVLVMWLEAYLSSKGPCAFNSGVVSK